MVDGQLKAQHASGFNARLKEIKNKLNAEDNALGEMPADLASYLAWLSIGSPAVCAYRGAQFSQGGSSIPAFARCKHHRFFLCCPVQ